MRILVDNIQSEKNTLEKELESYENNNLNLHNELLQIMDYWQDPFSVSLKKELQKYKLEENEINKSLKEMLNIYDFVIKQFSQIGNKIEYNLDNRDLINQKFDNCKEKIKKIISLYNSLNIDATDSLCFLIEKEKIVFNSMLKQTNEIQNSFKDKLNEIKELEDKINSKTNKINIKKIKQLEVEKLVEND